MLPCFTVLWYLCCLALGWPLGCLVFPIGFFLNYWAAIWLIENVVVADPFARWSLEHGSLPKWFIYLLLGESFLPTSIVSLVAELPFWLGRQLLLAADKIVHLFLLPHPSDRPWRRKRQRRRPSRIA